MPCTHKLLLVGAALVAGLASGDPAADSSGLEGSGVQHAQGSSKLRGSVHVGNASESPAVGELAAVAGWTNATGEGQAVGPLTDLDVGTMAAMAGCSGWSKGGDKMWGAGTGIEVVDAKNVGYYDCGMDAARARCGDAGCALIVNPRCCRTRNRFHIHFVHYKSYGKSLKARAESLTCQTPGVWQSGPLPCGGKAAFFSGWPGVFSKALSETISGASVIAWPMACGGTGTIIELAYGCSIEHQIRGDYRPGGR